MSRRRFLPLLIACALLVSLALPAHAESMPTRVILSYIPTISNWGPETANGVALIAFDEGDVRADLVGLPSLGVHERYQLWLRNSRSGATFALARFDAAPDGMVTYVDQELPEAIPAQGWDSVLITIEPEPDPDPAPGTQRFITGSIPGTPAELEQLPPSLPKTGGGGASSGTPMGGLLATNLALLGLLGWWSSRRGRVGSDAAQTPTARPRQTMEEQP